MLMASTTLFANIELPAMFSDNMILQQKTDAPIWGKASPNKKVKVLTSWDNKEYNVKASADGSWSLKMQTPSAGGPFSITVSDGKQIKLNNVLIGEIWICSGQSNMEMPVEGWGMVDNHAQEVQAADYPNIRLLQVGHVTSPVALSTLKVEGGGWQVCSPKTVANFSAAAYFFGRNLHQNLNVPIGLINTSWGGTIAETWASGETLEAMPDFKDAVAQIRKMPATAEGQEKLYREKIADWKNSVLSKDPGFNNNVPVWALPSTKDDSWKSMKVPGFIQDQGLEKFNGIIWFRKTLTIPSEWEVKELILNLGGIDDMDITYFNGVEIGHNENWMASRSYKIPAKLVKKGESVITVRIFDTGGKGGIYGDAKNVNIQSDAKAQVDLSGDWKYMEALNIHDIPAMPQNSTGQPNYPTLLFNAMINPLIPYAFRGAIWYQGESNAGRAYQYRELFPLMIKDWRKQWNNDFPFYFVQLANFMKVQTEPEESSWAELREAQSMTLNLKNTGMAVTTDIGNANDIHPKNKQEVGRRLALAARAQTYGEKIEYSGPEYQSYCMEGNKIRITFKHTEGGLKTSNGTKMEGFTIAGLDHKFYWADAVIDGNTVLVSSPNVAYPIAVRYGWANNPLNNLQNGSGLPASPFRTDDWQGMTYGVTR